MKELNWDSFYGFLKAQGRVLPDYAEEGMTMGSQSVTAISRLVSMWLENGDVFHNEFVDTWLNDLSSEAEWLYYNIPETKGELEKVLDSSITEEGYAEVLYNVYKIIESKIGELNALPKKGNINKNSEERVFFVVLSKEDEEYKKYIPSA